MGWEGLSLYTTLLMMKILRMTQYIYCILELVPKFYHFLVCDVMQDSYHQQWHMALSMPPYTNICAHDMST